VSSGEGPACREPEIRPEGSPSVKDTGSPRSRSTQAISVTRDSAATVNISPACPPGGNLPYTEVRNLPNGKAS